MIMKLLTHEFKMPVQTKTDGKDANPAELDDGKTSKLLLVIVSKWYEILDLRARPVPTESSGGLD